ncbi:hypothetical protein GCM10010176_056880 [Nonomuraea spiralis]|nr:hypothetical protein GCM10010176_056880 [Nonomuraea spiralis]
MLWSRYRTFEDLAAGGAAALRGEPLMAPLDQPGVGPHLAPGGPLLLDGRQVPPSPAPELGEHTDEVLADLLSLSPPELASLRADGVVA